MLRIANPLHRFAFLVAVLTGWQASALHGQAASPRPWTVTAALTGLGTGATAGWVYGPELGLRRDFGRHWGVGLRAALPVFDTEAYTDDGAAAIDLGPTLTFATDKAEFGLTAGATGFLVADGGELIGAGIGAFAGGHVTAWLTRSVGAVASANVRIAAGGAAYPSLSAGLAVRF